MNLETGKKSILVPIDFSEITLVALKQAINLARVINGEITLINVLEDHGFFNKYISKTEHTEIEAKTKKSLEELAEKESADSGIHIHTIIKFGKIYEQVSRTAEEMKATVILMGTSGSMGIMKFIGSNTLRVIRDSQVPVISIKGSKIDEGLTNILVPLDLTKETKEKVAKAIWLSKLYGGVTINIVSISTSTDTFLVNKMKKQEIQVKKFLAGKGIRCNSKMIKNLEGKSLSQNIIDYGKEVNAGIIMIMTQQETDITEMFIGSSAQAIINNSEIPVLSVVPAPKKHGSIIGS